MCSDEGDGFVGGFAPPLHLQRVIAIARSMKPMTCASSLTRASFSFLVLLLCSFSWSSSSGFFCPLLFLRAYSSTGCKVKKLLVPDVKIQSE